MDRTVAIARDLLMNGTETDDQRIRTDPSDDSDDSDDKATTKTGLRSERGFLIE
jgi:hypothetical protein